jgi:RES domain-containing protein
MADTAEATPKCVWRIAKETADYKAVDLSGAGAAKTGNRWNTPGTPVVYCSSSIALASLELFAHLGEIAKLRNYFLLCITLPGSSWAARTRLDPAHLPTWNAVPAGITSMTYGSDWAQSNTSLLLEVPSVMIPEENNVLINPRHPDATLVSVTVLRQFQFDPRMDR